MQSTHAHLLSSLLFAASMLLGAGCGSHDITAGKEQVGQRCLDTSDCASGLVCQGRLCLPGALGANTSTSTTGGGTSTSSVATGTGVTTSTSSTSGMCTEGSRVCQDQFTGLFCSGGSYSAIFRCADGTMCSEKGCVAPSSRCPSQERCIDDFVVTTCTTRPNGDIVIGRERCPQGLECAQGRCQRDPIRDRDGDGFDARSDCDDMDPDINPSQRESCGNGVDDNCDGFIDQQDEQCVANQRCAKQGDRCRGERDSTGFYACVDTNGDGSFYCYGACDPSAPVNRCPDQPESHRCISLDQSATRGLCVTQCERGSNTCALPFSCLALGASGYGNEDLIPPSFGGCIDSDQGRLGGLCDEDRPFCGQGGLCVDSRCTESCQPHQFPAPAYTCPNSLECNPASSVLGVCQTASMCASNRDLGRVCGANGQVCLRDGQGRATCQQTCRLGFSGVIPNADCLESNGTCVANPQLANRVGLGVCR